MRPDFVPAPGPRRRAGWWSPASPLIRDARYALGLQLFGCVLGLAGFLKDPVSGAIIFAALIISGTILGIYSYQVREKATGSYEVLEHVQTWDLNDPTGNRASRERRFRVRYLQDTILIRDYLWGEGVHVGWDYTCTPGRVVDIYRTGPYFHVLIALDETRRRGDIEEFTITNDLVGSFTTDREWISFLVMHHTEMARIVVLFPEERPAEVLSLTRDMGTEEIPGAIEVDEVDGRQRVTATLDHPTIKQVYTLRWRW
jgi:hypothetical protein